MANAYFQFRRVDNFDRDKNRKDCFDVLDMDGVTPNYKLVLASDCPMDIEDCLDKDGTLNDDVEILYTLGAEDGLLPLLYSQGINGEGTIAVQATSVSYELTDSYDYVKAAFLVSYGNGSGYVLAYSINNVVLEIQEDHLMLNLNGMIWGNQTVEGS